MVNVSVTMHRGYAADYQLMRIVDFVPTEYWLPLTQHEHMQNVVAKKGKKKVHYSGNKLWLFRATFQGLVMYNDTKYHH